MCPACLTAAAVTVVGAASSGGVVAIVIKKIWNALEGARRSGDED